MSRFLSRPAFHINNPNFDNGCYKVLPIMPSRTRERPKAEREQYIAISRNKYSHNPKRTFSENEHS